MSIPIDLPLLVSWKTSRKVPIEVVREIKRRGVEDLASELLIERRNLKTAKVSAIRWRAYALLAWCVQENSPPPAALMRLLFECMDLKDGRPHKAVCKRYKWPNLAKASLEDYDRVVAVDAQSMLDTDDELTPRALAIKTGVAWKSINAWRKTPEYDRRRNAALFKLRLAKDQSG